MSKEEIADEKQAASTGREGTSSRESSVEGRNSS